MSHRTGDSLGPLALRGDLEGRIEKLEMHVEMVRLDLYNGNDGKSGLAYEMRAFLTEQKERDRMSARAWFWFRWIVGTVVAIAAVSVAAYYGARAVSDVAIPV